VSPRELRERVVITGIGLVSPLGIGRTETWTAALAGRSGAGPITRFDASDHAARIAFEVKGFDPLTYIDRRAARRMDRSSQLAVAAAALAIEDAGLVIPADAERYGAVISTGNGGNATYEDAHRTLLERGPDRISPVALPMIICNMAAGHVSITYGLQGPLTCVLTACASSLHALGEAADVIRRGAADVMLAGGSEAAVTPYAMAALDASRAMSHRNDDPAGASRPFDAQRDGFVLGEGGAILVLERMDLALARGATIIAELAGYGATSDAHHITEPDPEGSEQARAIRRALASGDIDPSTVDHVNAHATSTLVGDVSEVQGIITALGAAHAEHIAVSATKSMHGHCLGATGALEASLAALAVADQTVPPTINLENLDPACEGVDHVRATRKQAIRTALCSGFGFGGHNAVLAFTKVGE
jgi:3-oxoacyl-[acyl-carrier-protein] synthase II